MKFKKLVVKEMKEGTGFKCKIFLNNSRIKNADIAVYIVNLADFDEFLYESKEENRMKEALETFETTLSFDMFQNKNVYVFFNKKDLLKKKILAGGSIKNVFQDYKEDHDVDKIEKFIIEQFLNLWKWDPSYLHSFSGQIWDDGDVKKVFEQVNSIAEQLKKKNG